MENRLSHTGIVYRHRPRFSILLQSLSWLYFHCKRRIMKSIPDCAGKDFRSFGKRYCHEAFCPFSAFHHPAVRHTGRTGRQTAATRPSLRRHGTPAATAQATTGTTAPSPFLAYIVRFRIRWSIVVIPGIFAILLLLSVWPVLSLSVPNHRHPIVTDPVYREE